MRTIVVIGGIGSGKSTVSRAFRELGAEYIDLDAVGHDILRRHDVKADLRRAFGDGVIGPDDEVVRPELAKRAFASPEKTELLNQITQPRLIEDAKARLAAYREQGAPATVVEISPYDGPQGRFGVFTDIANATVAVVAPLEERVRRATANGRFTEEDVRNRIARQATDDERRQWADYVIVNDSTPEALRKAAGVIWEKIVEKPERAEDKVSEGLRSLEGAYTSRTVSASMMLLGGGIVLAGLVLIGLLVLLSQ